MSQPILYLMLGYPGAGKTTAAKIIHELTGATHLWADHERRAKFDIPTYSHEENTELYENLNKRTEHMLGEGNSVIFDTNFNFYKDREHLRSIAKQYGAKTVLIWVKVPKDVAKKRATELSVQHHTRVLGHMPKEHFERLANNLEEPREGETHVVIEGPEITNQQVKQALEL